VADENKIQLDIEISESATDKAFGIVDERATKSAKSSAAVFGEYFQKQERELQGSIERIVGNSKAVAQKSAQESASVFAEAFKKQDAVYRASVKQNIDNAINSLTGGDKIKKSAEESAAIFEQAFQAQSKNIFTGVNFTELAAKWYLVKQAIDVVKRGVEEVFGVILEGEAKIKLEKSFNALADSARVAADVLRVDMMQAVRGLVDDDRLLQLASESFVNLGNNAKKLPDILELARKTYRIFGGDIVDNAGKIQNAIVSGNTRSLRAIGLYVDLDKAITNYARNIGTVPKLLSESEIQQARLNAILAVGESRFKNTVEASNSAKDSLLVLKNTIKELGDSVQVFLSNKFSSGISDIATGLSAFLKAQNELASGKQAADSVETLTTKIKVLEGSVSSARTQLENYNAVERFILGTDTQATIDRGIIKIEALRKKLAELVIDQDKQKAAQSNVAPPEITDTNNAAFIQARQELVNKIKELNSQQSASEVQLAQERVNVLNSQANVEKLYYEQRKQATNEFATQSAALEKFYLENGIQDEALRQKGRESLDEAHYNKLLSLKENYQRASKNSTDLFTQDQFNTFIYLAGIVEVAFDNMSKKVTINLTEVTKKVMQAGAAIAVEIGKNLGASLIQGQDAWASFKTNILNIIGDMLISIGSQMILTGLAIDALKASLLTLNGAAAVAAGLALVAVGGALKASATQGASTGNLSSAGGGSAAYTPGTENTITSPTNPEDTKPTTPQTNVNLTINGNILDRRETGLEIAQILQEQFSQQGLVIQGA